MDTRSQSQRAAVGKYLPSVSGNVSTDSYANHLDPMADFRIEVMDMP